MGLPATTKRRRPNGFVIFWAGFFAFAAAGAGYLQYLGPPPGYNPTGTAIAASVAANAGTARPPLAGSYIVAAAKPPALAPATTSMLAPAGAAKVAILLAGLGYDPAQSLQAATSLPAAISFAVSPFGGYLTETEAYAKANGHEMLLMLPMQALLARAPAGQNQALLDWSFKRLHDYHGVTDAIGPAMGGGFMQDANAKAWLLSNIAAQKFFYVEGDPTAGADEPAAARDADIVIDPVNRPQDETGQLAQLVSMAKAGHAALGIVLSPAPASLGILATWASGLGAQGVTLVPVSALIPKPSTESASSQP